MQMGSFGTSPGEPAAMADQARRFLARVEAGQVEAILEDVIVAELVWTLHSFYGRSKAQIAELLEPIVALPGLLNSDRESLLQALWLYVQFNVDFADALLAAKALTSGDNTVCSFDRDFERMPGLRREEPG